jgi:hypothetical protein
MVSRNLLKLLHKFYPKKFLGKEENYENTRRKQNQ